MFGKALKIPSWGTVHSPLVLQSSPLWKQPKVQSVVDPHVHYCPCTDFFQSWLSQMIISYRFNRISGSLEHSSSLETVTCYVSTYPFNLFSLLFSRYYFCISTHRQLEKLFTYTQREGVILFCWLKQDNLNKCIWRRWWRGRFSCKAWKEMITRFMK